MIVLLFAVIGAIAFISYDFFSARPDLIGEDMLRWILVGGFASFSVVVVRLISYLLIDVAFTRLSRKEPSQLLRLVVAVMLYGVAITAIMRFVLQADIAAIVTSTAILTALVGFALQATLGNVFEGLSVQIHQPFHIGDRVEIGEFYGIVESLTWRAVMIRQEDDTIVAIPNNMLASGPIRVFPAEQAVRAAVFFPAPIDVPPRRVTNVVGAALASSTEILSNRRPEVLVHEIAAGDSALVYEARFYMYPEREIDAVSGHIRERIWYALARAGIPMPAGIEATVDAFKVPLLRTNTDTLLSEKDDLIVMSSVELFKGVPLQTVSELLTLGVRLIFAPGETITISGVSRYSLFVVMRGLVSVPLPVGAEEIEENTLHVESYWQPEVLEKISHQFAEYMGPMSAYLVRNAARQTSDPYHLYRILAEDIPTKEERTAFIAQGPESPSREIEPGGFFGENALLLGEALMDTNIRAVSEVELMEISSSAMRSVIRTHPQMVEPLVENLAAHIQKEDGVTVDLIDLARQMQRFIGEATT